MQGVKDHMDIKSASTNVWCPYEQWIQVTDTQSHFSSNKDSAIANFVEAHNMWPLTSWKLRKQCPCTNLGCEDCVQQCNNTCLLCSTDTTFMMQTHLKGFDVYSKCFSRLMCMVFDITQLSVPSGHSAFSCFSPRIWTAVLAFRILMWVETWITMQTHLRITRVITSPPIFLSWQLTYFPCWISLELVYAQNGKL